MKETTVPEKLLSPKAGITQISLTTPEKKGKYEIPILIYERKTGKTKCKLTFEVID